MLNDLNDYLNFEDSNIESYDDEMHLNMARYCYIWYVYGFEDPYYLLYQVEGTIQKADSLKKY